MGWLIMIGVLVLAFGGLFAHDRIQTGRLDSAQAATRIANSRADDAEAANVTLRTSVKKVATEAAACTAKTGEFQKAAADAEQRATDAINAKAAAQKSTQLALTALKSKASGPPTVGDACKEADAILSDLSRDIRSILGIDKP